MFFSAVDAAYRHIQPYLVTDASSTTNKEWHDKNAQRFKQVIGPLISTQELIQQLQKKGTEK